MRAASPPLRRASPPTHVVGGIAARQAGVAGFASAVGNRAFTQHVARCGDGSHGSCGCGGGGGKCSCGGAGGCSCGGGSSKANRSDGSSRPWYDSLAEYGAAAMLGPLGWAYLGAKAAAGGGSGAGSGAKCAAGTEAKKATVSIQPVLIADDDGKNPTSAPSMTKVQEIWKKCCIDVTIAASKTISKKDYKTLDESPNDTPTAEETKMFADGGTFAGVQVYVPVEFKMGTKQGKDVNGGGATYEANKSNPKIVVVEGTSPEVVAHELGHATGHLTHDTADTVMKPTGKHNVANKTAVSAGVCKDARKGPVLTTSADDCCMDPK